MKNLKEAMKEVNELVIDQGKDIDKMEKNIENAKEKVIQGADNIEKAEEHQKSSRNIYLLLLCFFLLLVLGLTLFLRKKLK